MKITRKDNNEAYRNDYCPHCEKHVAMIKFIILSPIIEKGGFTKECPHCGDRIQLLSSGSDTDIVETIPKARDNSKV